MLNIINTIVPIFAVIVLGWLLRFRDLLPQQMMGPLNRLVYFLAIPAMIFHAVAKARFQTSLNPHLLAGTLVPLLIVFGIALGAGRLLAFPRNRMGTFLQSSFHGNLGYVGLAVCFYLLGHEGFARASILAGFLMLLQNFLAVLGLMLFSGEGGPRKRILFLARKILGNPVILSVLAGILFSLTGMPMPEILDRTLRIISGMALPLALLVIGASLSFTLIRANMRPAFAASVLKLMALPGLGLLIFRLLNVPAVQYLPAVILLATPTATVSYVMAAEMNGSPDLASATISMNTILSASTFIFWLGLLV
jgi:predicted permease